MRSLRHLLNLLQAPVLRWSMPMLEEARAKRTPRQTIALCGNGFTTTHAWHWFPRMAAPGCCGYARCWKDVWQTVAANRCERRLKQRGVRGETPHAGRMGPGLIMRLARVVLS